MLERIGTDDASAVLASHLLDGDAGLRLRILVSLARMRDERADVAIDPAPSTPRSARRCWATTAPTRS